ncbi:MAG: YqaE/Pmp3 family membrane protein [Crocinitomicaceae bacterium]
MKKVSILSLITLVAIVISSCGSSNNVVSNSIFSKRKYNKGIFINKKANYKTADAKTKSTDIKEDKSIAKAEKVTAKQEKKAQKRNVLETTIATTDVETEAFNIVVPNEGLAEQSPIETRALLSDDSDDLEWMEVETNEAQSGESVQQNTAPYTTKSSKKGLSGWAAAVDGMTVLLVILALFIPPLAVFIFEGATSRFWIDLLLAILGIGLGIGLGGLAYLAALAAVIYAVLIVLSVI